MLVGPLHIRKTCVFDWFFQMKTQNVGKYICIIKIKTYLEKIYVCIGIRVVIKQTASQENAEQSMLSLQLFFWGKIESSSVCELCL